MNIGILTFHWATNYGAVLQCYALQAYLENLGNNVCIINYKPKKFNDTFYNYIVNKKFLRHSEYVLERTKENALISFRESHLKLTKRISKILEIPSVCQNFDLIISGSDQVLNPSFLLNGEGHRVVSTAYYLSFPFKGIKAGYAVSFGCTTFPKNVLQLAKENISNFHYIGVREQSGIDIVKMLGRNDSVLVPDPTLLMESLFFHSLAGELKLISNDKYIYGFFIRHVIERKRIINSLLYNDLIIWNNEDGDHTIQGWLNKIKYANFVITDSFHCVVMCLKLHVPFIVVTELEGKVGMNDRLYTLLDSLGLSDRIVYKEKLSIILQLYKQEILWNHIDEQLFLIKNIGENFLKKICRLSRK